MDKHYYKERVMQHSMTKLSMKSIREEWCNEKQLINNFRIPLPKKADYLCNFEIKESHFYELPKVHKSSKVKGAIEEQKNKYIEIKHQGDLILINTNHSGFGDVLVIFVISY